MQSLTVIIFKECGFFFSKVITDYEIIKLPKKLDVLVVEADHPLQPHVKIFDYFKRFNIIEFKSPAETFRLAEDLPRIFIYLGGILLNEKAATLENTTFSLVCSHRPVKLLKMYRDTVQRVKNGVYLIQGITQIPVYIVLANEVQGKLDKELALLKEFATGEERVKFITTVLHQVLAGNRKLAKYLYFFISLYRNELNEIMRREKINMTLVEKNIEAWNEELGLKERYKKEGIKEGERRIIGKMKAAGYNLEDISKATGYTKAQIKAFLKETKK